MKIRLIISSLVLGVSTWAFVHVVATQESSNDQWDGTILVFTFMAMGMSFACIQKLISRRR